MRSNILYAAMITTLGVTTWCMLPQASANSEALQQVSNRNDMEWLAHPPIVVATAHTEALVADCSTCHDAAPAITHATPAAPVELSRGADASTVRTLLGEPASTSVEGARWNYPDRVVIFRDDKVAGWIEADAGEPNAIRSLEGVSQAAITPREPHMAGRFYEPKPQTRTRASSNRQREDAFGIHERLSARRSFNSRTFRQPEFVRAFGRALDKADRDQRLDAQRRDNSR